MDIELLIKQLFNKYNIELTQQQTQDFVTYYNLLIEWNQKFNLTAITEPQEIVEKHFIDSLACLNELNSSQKIIDIGAGAGFPSIPLNIMNRDLNIILVDSVNKKISFLQEVIKQLKLSNTVAIHSRIEDLANNETYREQFDVCLSRAVARLNTLVEYALPLIKINGMMLAYKSKLVDEEVDEAKNAIKILGGELKQVQKFDLSNQKRAIVQIVKKQTTSKNYPRKNNKARLQPLT